MSTAHSLGKPPIVGEFFESHMASLLGLKRWENEGIDGDLELNGKELWMVVEVKASDNNHHFRISWPQLKRYCKLEGFPLDGCIYCLVGYRNRDPKTGKQGNRNRPLTRCTTQQDIEIFLAKKMDSIYLIDSMLLHTIGRKGGIQQGAIPFRPNLRTVVISRSWLNNLLESPEATLKKLNLKSKAWRIEDRQMAIKLTAGVLGEISPSIRVVYAIRKKYLKEVRHTIKNSRLSLFPELATA